MNILYRGTLPEDKEYEVVCRNCQSILRFKASEGRLTLSQKEGNFLTIICPICKDSIHQQITARSPMGNYSE
jgi:RNase P subunit RPR2